MDPRHLVKGWVGAGPEFEFPTGLDNTAPSTSLHLRCGTRCQRGLRTPPNHVTRWLDSTTDPPSCHLLCQLAFTPLLIKHYRLSYFSALAYMHTLTYTHLCVHTCTHLHTHSPGSTCTHTCTHVCTHTLTHSHLYTLTMVTLTHMHTSTYTANHETGEKSLLRELPQNIQLCNDNTKPAAHSSKPATPVFLWAASSVQGLSKHVTAAPLLQVQAGCHQA